MIPVSVIAVMLAAAPGAPPSAPANLEKSVLGTLDKSHPRLMLKDADLAAIRKSLADGKDAALKRCVDETIKKADKCLAAPALEHKLVGPRLLSVSRECVNRVYALGLAWRLTGQDKYAKAALGNALTVCDFADWNPSHFLDTAEMSHAVGVAYDWLYSYADAGAKARLREGLVKLGLLPGLKVYEVDGWWSKSSHNWNQVCNGGLLSGALAIADEEPELCAKIVSHAVRSLPLALATYAPDGAWGEGPGYWEYATRYTAYGLTALRTALGTDFDLTKSPGLDRAGYFPIEMAGPSREMLAFADVGEHPMLKSRATMFWLARTYKDDTLAAWEHASITRYGSEPQHLLWYVPPPDNAARLLAALPLDARFRGPVEVATFRSGWDQTALFAGIKAGYNQVNHGHLDLGNFEVDALGVRWARDLGSDDYNLPKYWEKETQSGVRWTYYRLASPSHNVLLVNDGSKRGDNQVATAKSAMTGFAGGEQPHALVDLTAAYAPSARAAVRGLALVQSRRAVLVQDELDLASQADVTWGMTTDAQIKLDGAAATLTLKGAKGQVSLKATILSPAGAVFSTESARQQPPQKTNEGVQRLLVKLPAQKGALRLTVLLAPDWPDGKPLAQPPVKPLENW